MSNVLLRLTMRNAVCRTFKQFLKTTTLHGFKYFASPYYFDRAAWLSWSVASACCAGVLCAVLWARFLQTPALLTLLDLRAHGQFHHALPTVGVCLAPENIAAVIAERLTTNNTSTLTLTNDKNLIARLINMLLERKTASKGQLLLLESLLVSHDMTLSEAVMNFMPNCSTLISKCRMQNQIMPCSEMFHKELVERAGACCVMSGERGAVLIEQTPKSNLNKMIDLILVNVNGTTEYDYKFFTKYQGEDGTVAPLELDRGHFYFAQVTFTSVQDKDLDDLVFGACITDPQYSRSLCQVQCREMLCGCSDPLRTPASFEDMVPPTCTVSQMTCLNKFSPVLDPCGCKPACKFVTTLTALRALHLRKATDSFDPFYEGMVHTDSLVLSLRLRISSSKIFNRMSTETWFSLLSSFGGVFNMFLGVGLFSVLEVLFYLLVRLPITVRRTTEITDLVSIPRDAPPKIFATNTSHKTARLWSSLPRASEHHKITTNAIIE